MTAHRTVAATLALLALATVSASPGPVPLTGPEPAPEDIVSFAAPPSIQAAYHQASRTAELSNAGVKLALTHAPAETGTLTVLPIAGGASLVENASAALNLQDGSTVDLGAEGLPAGPISMEPVTEPVLGSGVRARAQTWVPRLGATVRTELTLFEQGPYFTYRLLLPAGSHAVTGFSYLGGTLFPNERPGRVTYLGDDDAVVEGAIGPGELTVEVGQGKPLLLRGPDDASALLMALLDPSDATSTLTTSALDKGVAFEWRHPYPLRAEYPGLSTQHSALSTDSGWVALPRMFVQLVDGRDLSGAFAPYRSLTRALYPPAPLPAWFRHQWISWYLYGMEIDEEKLKSQIDYVAANLNDVGPWSILVDAGWYVAEGRPDSDWRRVDMAKFPSGLPALVDYAHQRDVRVVLYFSASYLDDRAAPGNWLGLKGIIDRHPDWLLPIRSGDSWRAYYYDFSNPEFQDYLRQVLRDYFVTYGVDGIKVDGLMDSRLAVERGIERGYYSPADAPAFPTTSAYAFIYEESVALRPDVYVESGWRMPQFSAPHYTVARQSDDTPDFDSPYPAPGLRGHVDYAIAQVLLLGQRPHLGNYWGDPNGNPIGLQWLDAGLALNAPVVLGFDLNAMSDRALSDYRARLAMLRPFSGEVRIPGRLDPDSFSATSGGATFLALFNRDDRPKEIRWEAADHGFPAGEPVAALDVETGRTLPVLGATTTRVEPHSLRLLALRSTPGVLWTNSGFQVGDSSEDGLSLLMNGPERLPGYAYLAAPRPSAVLLNGQPAPADSWSYDDEAGVLRVDYPHDPTGTAIEVRY